MSPDAVISSVLCTLDIQSQSENNMQKAKVLKKYKTKDEKGKCTCGTSIHHPRQGQFTLEVKYCFSHLGGGRIFSFMAFVKYNLIEVTGQGSKALQDFCKLCTVNLNFY